VAADSLEVTQVFLGSHTAVQDGNHPAKLPADEIVLDLLDHGHIGGVSRPDPTAHQDAVPGHRQADHHLGRSGRESLEWPRRLKPSSSSLVSWLNAVSSQVGALVGYRFKGMGQIRTEFAQFI
jgi:hypothetical protein